VRAVFSFEWPLFNPIKEESSDADYHWI